MHLIFENVLTLLTLLWTGQFKGLNEGTESYQIPSNVWDAIGQSTAAAGLTIPGAFGQRLPNVATNKTACTADSWCFWLLYIAPVLLSRKFDNAVYFNHFIALVKLVNICLQFEVSRDEVAMVRQGFIDWVEEYERIYYQYSPERLSTCTLNVHALLHLADNIEALGPVWAYWAFPMEHFCGLLQPAIRSRCYPFASIDQHVISVAHLSQIKIRHACANLISLQCKHDDIPRNAYAVPGFADKIVIHLATRYQLSRHLHIVRHHFKIENVEQWSKVQRLEGGDDMYASSLEANLPEDRRDATFIWYDVLVDKNARRPRLAPSYYMKTFYGQLQNIIVICIPATMDLGLDEPQVLLLAVIQQCVVEAKNTLGWSFYTKMGLMEVVDMTCMQCLIGRVPTLGGQMALIDRSNNIQCSYYDPAV
ncbi:hypothetical protein F5146DRAFT_1169568 [Armillaria mellea]|nr:hypothetical protein F5146DRAFT_1169568 [Armillaria mellea]